MASSTQMSASEWLAVREVVASKLQTSGSKQQKDTRLRIAENLMSSGFLDFEYIISQTTFGPNEMAAPLYSVTEESPEEGEA